MSFCYNFAAELFLEQTFNIFEETLLTKLSSKEGSTKHTKRLVGHGNLRCHAILSSNQKLLKQYRHLVELICSKYSITKLYNIVISSLLKCLRQMFT